MLNFCFSTFQLGLHLLNSCANRQALISTQISVNQNNFKVFSFWYNQNFFLLFFSTDFVLGFKFQWIKTTSKCFYFLNNLSFSSFFSTDFVLGFKFQWIKTTSRVALKKIAMSHNNFKSYVWYDSMWGSTLRFITL